jgi:hypothetical protein
MTCEKKPNFDLEKELHISERELMLYQRFRPDFRVSHKTTSVFLINKGKIRSDVQKYGRREGDGMPISSRRI